jgi:DNA-binding transcriptional ArsR family regulator
MIYLRGHLARPLDAALSNGSRVAVLRVLHDEDGDRGGREIARLAGINHQAAAQALAALEELGLVRRQDWGRKDVWRFERRHHVGEALHALFQAEKRHADEIAAAVKSRLKGKADAVVIVGDAAMGKLEPGKALELVAVCEPGKRRPLLEAARVLERDLKERFFLALKLEVRTGREAAASFEFADGWQLLPSEGRPSISSLGR